MTNVEINNFTFEYTGSSSVELETILGGLYIPRPIIHPIHRPPYYVFPVIKPGCLPIIPL